MRYLAKLSVHGPKADPDYWHLWEATEHWLEAIAKPPDHRGLTIAARTLAPLSDWAAWPGARVDRLEGWLPPSPITESWRFLDTFTQTALREVRIPLGHESWVRYVPGTVLRVKSSAAGWVARVMAEAAAEFHGPELEWREHGRAQHARRGDQGFVVVRHPKSGWREWVFREASDHEKGLSQIWGMVSDRLGTRPLRLAWQPPELPRVGQVAGLAVRVDQARISLPIASDPGPEVRRLNRRGVQLEAWWRFAHWSPAAALSLTLTTRQSAYARLEGLFELTGNDACGERALRREARRLPILDLRPLPFWEAVESGHYADVERWAKWHQDAQDLVVACRDFARKVYPRDTIRLPQGWSFSRLESGRGRWVVRHRQAPITVELLWPRSVHPGHLAVHMGGVVELGLDVLDPSGLVDRWHHDRRYWEAAVTSLLERVEEWIAGQEM